MENFINALESAIENQNWYGALFIALSIPDICGYLETPNDGSQARYERWFEEYMLERYSSKIGPDGTPHTFLSPSDCYALRCALLHEGREEIIEQQAREALDRFHFIEPPSEGLSIHCNQINNVLQLQTDIFCSDILAGLNNWCNAIKDRAEVEERINNNLKVYPSNEIPGLIKK